MKTAMLKLGLFSLIGITSIYVALSTIPPKPYGDILEFSPDERLHFKLHQSKAKNQPTFLLNHGLAGSMTDMEPLYKQLSRFGTVLNWDRLSYGHSQAAIPEALKLDYTYQRSKRLLEHLQLSPPYVYVGYSLGSIHATYFYRRNPELVQALVLIDPPLPAEKLRAKNFYNTQLPGFLHSLRKQAQFSRLGWPQLKATIRVLLGLEASEKQAIYSHSHQIASIREAESFVSFLDEVDYHTPFDGVSMLIFSRGMAVDQRIVEDVVRLSQHAEHKTYRNFRHSDFIKATAAERIAKDIVAFINNQ